MSLKKHFPDRPTSVLDTLKSRYSAKMMATLALVFMITLVSTVVFYANVSGELQQSADDAFADHTASAANVTALWADSNGAIATGVASSGAVESGEETRIATRLGEAAASNHVRAVHYVDRTSGEVQVSSQDSATGTQLNVSVPSGTTDTVIGRPQPSTTGNDTVIPFVAPVDGDRLVVVAASTSYLRTHFTDDRYATTLVANGTVIVPSGAEVWNDSAAAGVAGDGITTQTVGEEEFAATAVSVSNTDWTVVSYGSTQSVYSDQNTATAGLVALLFVIGLNLGLFGITIGGNLALALQQLGDRASEIGKGNLDVELETERTDEVGQLYAQFGTMRDSLRESLQEADEARAEAERAREEAEQRELQTQRFNEQLEAEAERYSETMAACADGDLTQRLESTTDTDCMESIAESFNEMIADIERTVADVQEFADTVANSSSEVESGAGEVRDASEEVSRSVQQISEGAQEQTEELQATADEVNDLSATVEEVAATTDQVTEQSDRVAELGSEGREQAQNTIEEMESIETQTHDVVNSIDRLTDEIEEISRVTQLIDDIAEQTSILALNANIEASRAGESGSGFAVVANEVKELSEETQEAVDEIESMVTSVQDLALDSAADIREAESRITEGTATVEELTESLDAVVDGVNNVDQGLKEINNATDDQARSTQEIVNMVDEVASISEETTQQAETVAAASEEATASVTEVSDSAAGLAARSKELKQMLAEFEIESRDAKAAIADGGASDD